ncbi:MAG: bifunctional folylpolyglutamate synthase/dihydrofolate synthase [Candidatus Komeilibacteria bacterium]
MGSHYNLKKYYRANDFLESLTNLHPSPQKRLKLLKEFLNSLGAPQNKYKIIHIAGTAGKGTVSSLVHSALVKAGYKVGLYTSPHTTTIIERIKLNDRYIAAEAFYHILDKIKPAMQDIDLPPNFFGMIIAIALTYFAEEKCDYVVLETGLGGDLDSTNVIPAPRTAVITNVGHDHNDVLGNTLLEIAGHKAGIIKKGTKSFFTAEANAKIVKLFKNTCAQKKVKFHHVKPNGDYFNDLNVRLAQAVVDDLGIISKIDKQIIKQSAKLPCRQEIMQNKPTVMLDGAHNPAKIQALSDYLHANKKRVDYLIIGVSANKDWRNILKIIAPESKKIILTRFITSRRSTASPLKMKQYLKKYFPRKQVEIYWDPLDALEDILQQAKKSDFILITGSMYLTGELRRFWIPENDILRQRISWPQT